MLGALFFVIGTAGLIGGGIKMVSDNRYYRENAKKWQEEGLNEANTWIDAKGIERDIDTGTQRRVVRNKRLDRIVTDQYGNFIRNIDVDNKIAETERKVTAAPAGTKAVYFDRWDRKYSQICKKNACGTMMDEVHGDIYKDVVTGECYIYRYFRWGSNCKDPYSEGRLGAGKYCKAGFYMNLTGYLVCRSDKRWDTDASDEDCQDFIKYFNQKQSEGGWFKDNTFGENGRLRTFYCNGWEG